MLPGRRVAAALAVLMIHSACAGWTPRGTVEAFYSAIAEGHPDDAIALLSSQARQNTDHQKLRAGFVKKTRLVMEKGGLKSLEITQEATAGEIASLTVRITYGNGSTDIDTVELIKEKDGWRIQPGNRK